MIADLIFRGKEFQKDAPGKDTATFKQVELWHWHVKFIPSVSGAGSVNNDELCRVV